MEVLPEPAAGVFPFEGLVLPAPADDVGDAPGTAGVSLGVGVAGACGACVSP